MIKKVLLTIIIINFIAFFSLIIYISVTDSKIKTESDIEGQNQNITNDEYIYKEDLLSLGYNVKVIEMIEEKIANLDVKNYLLSRKYDHFEEFANSEYFNIQNIERYEEYYLKHPEYTIDQVTLYVEIGLDYDFYTNINVVEDYTSITALVNKYNQIPDDATFNNLLTLPKPYSNNGKKHVRSEMYEPLKQMIDDAKKEGIKLVVISSYRDKTVQTNLFNKYTKNNGLDYALKYSAKPRHSEHELGLAIDFNTTQPTFKKSKEYKWLKDNAYKYGFIERYPDKKEFITGFAYEPWHYRYLGVDIATKIYIENITFEEYLVKYQK